MACRLHASRPASCLAGELPRFLTDVGPQGWTMGVPGADAIPCRGLLWLTALVCVQYSACAPRGRCLASGHAEELCYGSVWGAGNGG